MKPRIKKRYGLWYCKSAGRALGVGYSPAHAYRDWAQQITGG